VHDHAGEGDYDVTEKAIQDALAERDARLNVNTFMPIGVVNPANKVTVDTSKLGSPETYFGSGRNEYLANGKQYSNGIQNLTVPENIEENELYLGGSWNFSSEDAEGQGNNTINYKYKAKNVYMVASSEQGIDIGVYIDGKFLKTISIKDETLYTIFSGTDYDEHTLELKVEKAGLKAFTFTFG
jgi:hypothetical protein